MGLLPHTLISPNKNSGCIFPIDVGLVWDCCKLPYHSLAWQSSHTIPIAHSIPMYGNGMELYEIRSFSIDVGLIEPPIPFPYHSFAWQSSHTIPIAHIIPISGNCMELYEIRSFPIDKTIESHYMASYGFDMVGNVPYQKHMKSIYGP